MELFITFEIMSTQNKMYGFPSIDEIFTSTYQAVERVHAHQNLYQVVTCTYVTIIMILQKYY